MNLAPVLLDVLQGFTKAAHFVQLILYCFEVISTSWFQLVSGLECCQGIRRVAVLLP